jgi:mRNA-degrading endonuclease toxin of MazEF toxin-antitoxin module
LYSIDRHTSQLEELDAEGILPAFNYFTTIEPSGTNLVDQIKSMDYIGTKARFIGKAQSQLVTDALSRLDACLK